MATEKIRIEYVVDKKQLDASNKSLDKTVKANDLTQKEVDQTTEKFKKQEKQLSKTNKAFAGLGGQLTKLGNRFTIAGQGAGDMAAGLFKSSTAAGGMSKAMKILKVAIASTGIGLLVIALGSLVTFFTKTQRGSDAVSKAFAGIGAAVDVIIDRLSTMGSGLWMIIKGDFSAGLDVLKNSFKGVGDEIREESKAAIELEKRTQALIVTKRNFLKQEVLLNNEITAARLAAEDAQIKEGETGSQAQARQAAAIQVAIDKTKELADLKIDIAKEEFDIISAQVGLGESLNDELDKEAQAERDLLAIQGERDSQLKALTARQNTLTGALKEQSASKKEAADEEKQRQKEKDEQEKKDEETRLANIIKDAETLERKKQAISDLEVFKLESEGRLEEAEIEKRERLLENEELIEEERQLIIAQSEDRILAIKDEAAANDKKISDKKVGQEQKAGKATLDFAKQFAGEGTKLAKLAAVADIGIATASAIAKSVEISPATFGLPFSAFAAATGAIQTQSVLATPTKYEKGGKIGGRLHSSGGTLIEAERDEFIMSRKATAKYGFDFLDKINNLELNDLTTPGKNNTINIVDIKPIADQLSKMPQNVINVDSEGFLLHQRRGQDIMQQKIQRYST